MSRFTRFDIDSLFYSTSTHLGSQPACLVACPELFLAYCWRAFCLSSVFVLFCFFPVYFIFPLLNATFDSSSFSALFALGQLELLKAPLIWSPFKTKQDNFACYEFTWEPRTHTHTLFGRVRQTNFASFSCGPLASISRTFSIYNLAIAALCNITSTDCRRVSPCLLTGWSFSWVQTISVSIVRSFLSVNCDHLPTKENSPDVPFS